MEKQERFYFDVWIALLSTLAGMVNVVTLLLFFTPTTHFTGNITQFVLSFNERRMGDNATFTRNDSLFFWWRSLVGFSIFEEKI